MDIGATVCRPARPSCASCPAQPWCRAASELGDGDAGRRVGGGFRATRPAATRIAATRPQSTPTRSAAVPFEQTTRWLRGRLVDRLRDAAPGEVLAVDGPLGAHSPEAVARALAGLARDGLAELDAAGRARLAGSAGALVTARPPERP
jgi:hypothetical protein